MNKEKIYGLIILLFGLIGMIWFTILTLVRKLLAGEQFEAINNLLKPLYILEPEDAVMLKTV